MVFPNSAAFFYEGSDTVCTCSLVCWLSDDGELQIFFSIFFMHTSLMSSETAFRVAASELGLWNLMFSLIFSIEFSSLTNIMLSHLEIFSAHR